MTVSVSYVCVMHVCVVLSVIVQVHVFTPSLSLRHAGLVSHPPTMAAWQFLSQARNQGRWQSPAASGNVVIMDFSLALRMCRDLGIRLVF